MNDKLEVNIPFAGFYCSFYSDEIDRQEELFIENLFQNGEINAEQSEELARLLFLNTDYRQIYTQIARDYTDAFNEKFKEWTNVDLRLEFVMMTSPREYNFETDRIFAEADKAALLELRAKVDEEVFKEVIETRFTSRSGFISFYSNKLEEWESGEDGVLSWDQNQLCTLLMCFLPEDWEWDMYYATFYADEAYQAWERAVDWKPIEEFLEQCKEQHA